MVIRSRKLEDQKLSLTLRIVEEENKNRVIEFLSTIQLNPGGISELDYKVFCIQDFVVGFPSIMKKIFEVSKKVNEIQNYQIKIFKLVQSVNKQLNPKHIYISDSQTLTLFKTNSPLLECPAWKKKLNQDIGYLDPSILLQASTNVKEVEFARHVDRWETLDFSIWLREFSKKDKPTLLLGYHPKSTQAMKIFLTALGVDNFPQIQTFIKNSATLSNISDTTIISELYQKVLSHNPWMKNLRLSDFKKINKDYSQPAEKYATAGEIIDAFGDSQPSPRALKSIPRKDIFSLEDRMKTDIIAQEEAIQAVCSKIKQAYVGMKDPDAPIGAFLFYGATSVGKTEFAKSLARELTKTKRNLVSIPCNQLQQDFDLSVIMGSPPGYAGYDDGGVLANAVKSKPLRVVLFDEIEKASPAIFDLLLSIIDEGQVTDKRGEIVDFRNCIFIFTSNIGQKEANDALHCIGFNATTDQKAEAKVKRAEFNKVLKKKLKPEFVARLKVHGGIYYFQELTKQDLTLVAQREFLKLVENLKTNSKVNLVFEDNVADFLVTRVLESNARAHARDIKHRILKDIVNPMTQDLFQQQSRKKTEARVSISDENTYTISFIEQT